MTLTVGSLFSGIGGIDLGLERAGMTVKWQSEIDPFACKVLKKHWPNIPNLGDIKTVDWSNVEPVDLIAGGYPCQPFSTAGKRQGENDPRHLWPYFRNAISAIRPRYALLENVRGHLTMGATTVIGDLAQIGYDCEWQLISARSIGAPHKRERLFIVAHANSKRWERCFRTQETKPPYGRFDLQGENRRWGDNWVTEPDVGRISNGVPSRVDRLRGLGNAVVPQVAEFVGRLILQSQA
jgi:DNA (cytosine-5)-methyltransferase 1